MSWIEGVDEDIAEVVDMSHLSHPSRMRIPSGPGHWLISADVAAVG
ncbi:hypothetical protein ACH5A7_19950 [Streptomyces sp. NPDC018955]